MVKDPATKIAAQPGQILKHETRRVIYRIIYCIKSEESGRVDRGQGFKYISLLMSDVSFFAPESGKQPFCQNRI